MRASRPVLAVCLLSNILLYVRPAAAQSVYGEVWGRFTTASGAPISAASVTVTSVETGARSTTKSDAGGYFTISNLTPDLYQIEVQADGFKRLQGTTPVSADSTATVNATLQVGDPSAITERSPGTGTVLKLDRTDVATPFDSQSVTDLPLLDRNLTRLQLLAPGAARGRLAIPPNQNPQNGVPVNINGQHFSGAAFQLDGTENRDPLEGIVVINPTLDSVREMKVTTQGYNAEFGQATAGVITVQTRSGSNAWHGDAFGYRRTGWGQSTDPFAPAGVPPGKHILFGGALGGPIVKNKLFLVGDYEGTRVSQGANLLLNVTSENVLKTCLGSAGEVGSSCDLSDYSAFIDGPLHDDDKDNTPFPDYKIPNSRISDQAVALLKLVPLPNQLPADPICGTEKDRTVCDNYLTSGKENFDANRFNLRADYNLGSAVRLFGRYSFGEFSDTGTPAFGISAGGAGTNPLGFAGVARTRNQGISTGFTYSLSPKLLTDFRFGYFRYRLNNDSQDFGQIPPIGIKGIFSTDTHDPFATGMPDIQIPGQQTTDHGLSSSISGDYLRLGYSPAVNNCNCPLREREQQFQFVDNWTRNFGEHNVKWGADFRFLQNFRLASEQRRTGAFSFSPDITGLALATFLIGDVTSFERFFSAPAAVDAGERQKRFGFYGQDTWRINSRLTLSYGLRWEIYFPQTVSWAGGFLLPDLSNHDPGTTYIEAQRPNGAGNVKNSFRNFAPRLGIAYLLNPSTVIRAGYGRSFDTGYAGDLFGIAATQNPPVTVDQNIQAGGFNLKDGPPAFVFPSQSKFSLLDLASANIGDTAPFPPVPASGAVLYGLPSQIRVPTVDSWNLTVQHQLSSRMYFELAYVGNKGTHVFTDNGAGTYYNLNQTTLEGEIHKIDDIKKDRPMCRRGSIFKLDDGTPTYCLLLAQYRGFYKRVQIDSNKCSPDPCIFDATLFPVRYFGNDAGDNYHSLQAKLHRNFSRGYSFMAHYTWSRAFDYDDNYFRVDPSVGYGSASFDITHRFVMTNIWDLPIGRGKALLGGISPVADRFLGGWTLSAITIWQSGFPFTPSYRKRVCALDTDSNAPCRPNRVGPVGISGNREQYFTTTGGNALEGKSCILNNQGKPTNVCGVDPATGDPVPGVPNGPWQRPGAGQIGNVGRNSFRGPSFFQSDIALAKVIALTEGTSLRFRVDAFNAFNKVNLANPNPCVDCDGGGSIGSLAQGGMQRTLQFALKFEF